MRRSAELFARELALTKSDTGERLHATVFKGAELSEGCVEIPVSLQLVSLIEQYDALQDGCAPNDAISLENSIRGLADSIVREMKGDRVTKELSSLWRGDVAAETEMYVNWRAMVMKLHETLAHVEGLADVLELHSEPKVRKQVALAVLPQKDLVDTDQSPQGALGPGGSNHPSSKKPLFHRPRFDALRARARPSTYKAREHERKQQLLAQTTALRGEVSLFDLAATETTGAAAATTGALPTRSVTPSSEEIEGLSAAAAGAAGDTPQQQHRTTTTTPTTTTVEVSSVNTSGAASTPVKVLSPPSRTHNMSAPGSALLSTLEPMRQRMPVRMEALVEEEELSASLPSRFAGAGPIPPSRLTDAISMGRPRSTSSNPSVLGLSLAGTELFEMSPLRSVASTAATTSATSSSDGGSAAAPATSASSSSTTHHHHLSSVPDIKQSVEGAPIFKETPLFEQFVVVQPTDHYLGKRRDPGRSSPSTAAPADDHLWDKAPEWMHFIVHWNGKSVVAGPSVDPRGARIPLAFLLLAVQAHGEYDHALLVALCLALWRAASSPKLTLGPYLPPKFLERNNIQMQNRALSYLEKEFQLICQGTISEAKIASYVKHFVASAGDAKATGQVLDRISKGVSFCLRSNSVHSLSRYERLCIRLLGAEDESARESAVKLLNMIYDGHTWQRHDAFDPVMRSVGDAFVVELDTHSVGDVLPSNVLLQVFMAPTSGNGSRVLFTAFPRLVDIGEGRSKLVCDVLPAFYRCGFVDWRFVHIDDTGLLTPLAGLASAGRVIVMPAQVRSDIIHEVTVSPNVQKSATFREQAQRLADIRRATGANIIYISGACAGASLDELSDRRLASVAAGGEEGFADLVAEARRLSMDVIVDADHRVSVRHARRYRPLVAFGMDSTRRFPIPIEGHDGLHMPFPKCVTLNYRLKETWDELVGDVVAWCEKGASGVRLAASHCAPLLLRTDIEEMARLDPDGKPHYSVDEILRGHICKAPSNESVTWGYYGTEAAATYANPLLLKIAMTTWRQFPNARLFAESYWGRASNALACGFIPQSAELTVALNSVFGVEVTPDARKLMLPARASVKALYQWFRDERARLPSNACIVNASSHHFLPYPIMLHGPGAWAIVDLLFFGPEIPSTFGGEFSGDSRWWASGQLSVSDTLARDIAKHYLHRARLRQNYRILRDGGFIPLLTFWGDDARAWHERVFAFARFSSDKVAICAINFNDAESVVYVDMSPLLELCDQAEGSIFKILDLIDPSAPPQFFAPSEFLHDRHYVPLAPYRSLLWGVFVEALSPSTERAGFEQSFRRLQMKLNKRVDASSNLVYKVLVQSFGSQTTFGEALTRLLRVLRPDPRASPFAEEMRQMLYQLTRGPNSTETVILNYLREISSAASHSSSSGGGGGGEDGVALRQLATQILAANEIGPIVFITPEMGRFSTVGGIGVMVSELTRSLADLGLDVRVISPYYNYDKKGNTGYLKAEGIEWQQNIITYAGNDFVECGLHTGEENGVKLYFIHHWKYFSTPYQSGTPVDQLQGLVVMAKSSLELLCQLQVIPSIVVTNDWFTGLVPAYARETGSFGSSFAGTTFFHLVHNLEQGYEGKIYIDGNDDLGHVHQMRRELIVEAFDGRVTVLNSSKCALLSCNQWGTVSKSYREDLLKTSPLQYLLRQFEAPFAHLNGIRLNDRLDALKKAGATDHAEAKRMVQEKYFGRADPNVALFAFVGRIVVQKGVHLILDCAKAILSRSTQVQIMVCGPANAKDPYAASCRWKMAALSKEFKASFWADPDLFFTDGALVNCGADFALMPSLFEPSGIVQQEFFSGSTPCIAFKTGGLKDTIFEFNPSTGLGNGFNFEAHQYDDLMQAMERALRVYRNAEQYAKLRVNARASVLDNNVVATEWAKEFCRLKQRMFANKNQLEGGGGGGEGKK